MKNGLVHLLLWISVAWWAVIVSKVLSSCLCPGLCCHTLLQLQSHDFVIIFPLQWTSKWWSDLRPVIKKAHEEEEVELRTVISFLSCSRAVNLIHSQSGLWCVADGSWALKVSSDETISLRLGCLCHLFHYLSFTLDFSKIFNTFM